MKGAKAAPKSVKSAKGTITKKSSGGDAAARKAAMAKIDLLECEMKCLTSELELIKAKVDLVKGMVGQQASSGGASSEESDDDVVPKQLKVIEEVE